MSANPYQFEPQKKVINNHDDDSNGSWEDIPEEVGEQEPQNNRLHVEPSEWCKCLFCCTMPVNRECLCCIEIDEIKLRYISGDSTCVTQHEGFNAICLSLHVLWTAMHISIRCISPIFLVRLYETWKIRSKNHPACVVSKIRETFPEANGIYVNFDGDDEGADGLSEVIEAWEYMANDEE
ncbi:uncharacterized protein LOC130657793 [Hydractinia symbiolongicarpus]|uniref:uncharacterized protein LOC130657793 n=1 Tax=Hydractinia symbiolongicarpus TaxID=13093 RepID=UPI00254DDE4F|nr:uncharacterized protein LOC130657793 [Hydractinia symbiolongicarpus]